MGDIDMRLEDIETLEALKGDIREISIQVAKVHSVIKNRRIARKLLATFGALHEAGYMIKEIVDSVQKIS